MAGMGTVLLGALVLLLATQAHGAKLTAEQEQRLREDTNKLVELIHKKDYDKFIKELDGVDANTPDSKGRLPLIEAVKTGDVRFVDALIQFGALANAKEPGAHTTPIKVAFQLAKADIARVLLQYGADLNVQDKSGAKPRDFAPKPAIRELIERYDKDGAMAFEDPPGTWIKAKTDAGDHYWFNVKTEEARWNAPPSCSWQRLTHQGQPTHYANSITGQEVTKRPAPLCWRLVRQGEKDLWYNWAVNISQLDPPDEMPEDMLQEARELKNVRWYNPRTQEFSWEDPLHHTPWRKLHDEEHGVYYFNVVTGQSEWEPPAELAWQLEEANSEHGQEVWRNSVTGETTTDRPAHHEWERHDDDL